jgi:MoxR-like ATPase
MAISNTVPTALYIQNAELKIDLGVNPEFSKVFWIYFNTVALVLNATMGYNLVSNVLDATKIEFFQTHTQITRCLKVIGLFVATGLTTNVSGALTFATLGVFHLVLILFFDQTEMKNKGAMPFLIDMEKEAAEGKYRPFIGSEETITIMEDVLSLPEKQNALLIGEMGVGKTAVVETIALKKVKNELSQNSPFRTKKIVRIDIAALMAGTEYRGQVAKKIKMIKEYIEREKNVVFFIDEIHSIVHAGIVKGSDVENVAGLLKEPLSRAGIVVIGATTPYDYKRAFPFDPAFWRRFSQVFIHPPRPERCLEMLRFQVDFFRAHYLREKKVAVNISDEAIKAAIFFTKDVKDNHLPDKAVDWLHKACLQECRKSRENPNAEIDIGPTAIAEVHSRYLATRYDRPYRCSPETLITFFDEHKNRYFQHR